MTTISPEILKGCDIRGVYPKPLGTAQAEQIGLGVGTLIKGEAHRNIKVVVGHDVRNSSESLNKALVHGLRTTGLKIVDAGLVSTPLLAFASRFAGAAAGIMITASHNAAEYNGFKFFTQGAPASLAWIERLYNVLKKQSFRKGAGVVERKDFYADYRNALVNTVAQNFQGFKMVVDFGNGAAALTVPMVLEALNCELDVLNGELDGNYPGRGADSSHPAVLRTLGERVRKVKARLGVAFDGDGDRISFVDERGREVSNDLILIFFAQDLLRKQKNLKVVYDGKCSDWVDMKVQEEGGIPILEKSGHSFIYGRMQREKAALGGEASGHFFLPGVFPGDALFACLSLLEILKESHKSLAQFFDQFPTRISTHDIKLELPADVVPQLYDVLTNRARDMGGKVSTVDGVRAIFNDGWGIVRQSVTEPVISCRFEALSDKKLTSIVGEWFQDSPEIRGMILKKIE
jgi:phosphomannomutase / phosphoglucomutase